MAGEAHPAGELMQVKAYLKYFLPSCVTSGFFETAQLPSMANTSGFGVLFFF